MFFYEVIVNFSIEYHDVELYAEIIGIESHIRTMILNMSIPRDAHLHMYLIYCFP